MQCLNCNAENREGVKICEECGAKLEILCPSCGQKVPWGKKFCGECGHGLISQAKQAAKELSFEEKLDKIQRYPPGGLTEKILAQRGKIEGERRQVTVMFCDMKGYTSLSESIGPEETYALMNEVYEILIHKVHDYGGTVNELTGDGIMALFGSPIAVEDAPQRAIRAALAIHKELAKRWKSGTAEERKLGSWEEPKSRRAEKRKTGIEKETKSRRLEASLLTSPPRLFRSSALPNFLP